MAKSRILRFEGGQLKEVSPDEVTYDQAVRVPALENVQLKEGPASPLLLPRLWSLQRERLLHVGRMRLEENPDALAVYEKELAAGRKPNAMLMLLVATYHPEAVGDAQTVFELQAESAGNIDPGKVRLLNAKLTSEGRILNVMKEIESILVIPEVGEPPGPAKEVIVKPRDDDFLNTFTEDAHLERAIVAADAFIDGGGRLDERQWGKVFEAVGRIQAEDDRVRLFEFVLEHTDDATVEVLTDTDRCIRAGQLVSAVVHDAVAGEHQKLRAEAFNTIYLTDAGWFERLTGDRSEAIATAVGDVSDNPENRMGFLEQAILEDGYLDLMLEPSRLDRAKLTVKMHSGLVKYIGDETNLRAVDAFKGVFLRPTEVLEIITSKAGHKRIFETRYGKNDVIEFSGEQWTNIADLIVRRPEAAVNFAGNPDSLRDFIMAVTEVGDREHLVNIIQAMRDSGSYAQQISRPEAMDRIRHYIEGDWTQKAGTEILLNPHFIAEEPEEQERILMTYQKLRESPDLAVEAPPRLEETPPSARPTEEAAGILSPYKPRAGRRMSVDRPMSFDEIVVIHGIQTRNPRTLTDEDWGGGAARVKLDFELMNDTFLNHEVLRGLTAGRYHQMQIVNYLSNQREGDFEVGVDELHSRLLLHPILRRVYLNHQDYLEDDLAALEKLGWVARDADRVRLSDQLTELQDAPLIDVAAPDQKWRRDTLLEFVPEPDERGPDYRELDGVIILALASTPNYSSKLMPLRQRIIDVTGADSGQITRRIDALRNNGVVLTLETGVRGLRMRVLAAVRLDAPRLYRENYPHAVDVQALMKNMYYTTYTAKEPAHSSFAHELHERADVIDRAVELLSTGGKGVTKHTDDKASARIKLGKQIVRAMSKISLHVDHGGKLEEIKRQAATVGLTDRYVDAILPRLVDAGLVRRVETGYYKVDSSWCRQVALKPGGIEFWPVGEADALAKAHSNILGLDDENEQDRTIREALEGTGMFDEALKLFNVMTNLSRNYVYGARAFEVGELLRREGIHVSDDQVRREFTALSRDVEMPKKAGATRLDDLLGWTYALIVQEKFSEHEVYYRLEPPQKKSSHPK